MCEIVIVIRNSCCLSENNVILFTLNAAVFVIFEFLFGVIAFFAVDLVYILVGEVILLLLLFFVVSSH